MSTRKIATICIFPEQGKSHASAGQLSALAAYARSLLTELPESERQRHVVLTNQKAVNPGTYNLDEIEVREVWLKGAWRYAWQILAAVRSLPSIRLVHLQHEFNQFGGVFTIPFIPLLMWALRWRGKKIVITFHEVVGRELLSVNKDDQFCLPVPLWAARFLFRAYYRIISRSADCILVQHPKFEKIMRDEMGIRAPVRILPIGTETDVKCASRDASRARWKYSPEDRVLLFFGTLDWRKGLDVLLDAFEQLPADGNYRLLIGGGQPVRIKHKPAYQAWFSSISERMAKNPNVQSIGFVADEDIPVLFAAADLVVLPYVVPQMVSAVLNHAASYQCPFIGSTAFDGHADELVLFEPESAALRDKIEWSFAGHMDELLGYARSYQIQNSWTRSAALLADCYQSILGENVLEERG